MSVPAAPLDLDAGTRSPARPDRSPLTVRPHSDGAGFVPVQTRSERFTSREVAAFPAVTGREPEWKFSPVPRLRPLLEGALDGSPIALSVSEASGVRSEWVDRTDTRVGRAGTPEDRASANAWSSVQQAFVLTVTGEDAGLTTVTRASLDATPRAAHTVIVAAANSRGHIVLQNTGPAQLSENVEIVLEDGAHLTVVSVQEWDDDAIHLATHFSSVGRDAVLTHVVVSLDGSIVRLNSVARLDGDGAEVELDGAYFAGSGQHLEQQVFVDHVAPRTRSRVTYKGALQGRTARSVWIGDVLIRRTAVGTDSYEQNRNLLLTSGARADSIPNLEIETGDIAGAGHASASGRFDDEQLFYLQARGISESEARRLIVRGFLTEVVQRIGSPALEERLQAAIESALVPEGTPS